MEKVMVMNDSILDSIKMALGIQPEYTHFDSELIMHINSVFSTLYQLGVGTSSPYRIQNGEDLWSSFLEDSDEIDNVKSYMYLRVRLIFDPPSNSFVNESFKKQIEELEWRMNVSVDPGEDDE